MFDYSPIDRAAQDGFNSFTNGNRMPASIAQDQVLCDAWNIGRRLATEAAQKAAPITRVMASEVPTAGQN
jgi:hypothetical protein